MSFCRDRGLGMDPKTPKLGILKNETLINVFQNGKHSTPSLIHHVFTDYLLCQVPRSSIFGAHWLAG